jgi:UDP-3-O-[3-hydroxymyristoyl] glucosamine N-acyltransferase
VAAPGRFTLGELAAALGATLEGDPARVVTGVAPLDRAGPADISFLTDARHRTAARASRAGAFLAPADVTDLPGPTLRVAAPPQALITLLRLFHPPVPVSPGVDPTAAIAPEARLDPTASVGPLAVVAARARVGARVRVGALVYVGPEAEIGEDSVLHPGVVVRERVRLGRRVIVHAGAVLGADGFGYASGAGGHEKIPHVGVVVVEDDVEVGANACIDRAGLAETRIGRGTKIDNLVQVAHDVAVGPGCLLVAQSGIAGSTTLGEGCVLAGQSGVGGHLEVGDGVRVGAKSAVLADVPAGRTVSGIPAMPHARWRRVVAALPRLPDLVRAVRPRGATDDGETP